MALRNKSNERCFDAALCGDKVINEGTAFLRNPILPTCPLIMN